MPDTQTVQAWYLLQLKANSMQIAVRNLHRQGFRTFLPMQEATIRVQGRFKTGQKPLFPGYLFVEFDPDRGLWRKVNSTLGVARIVSFGSRPAAVPPALVSGLMARCDADGTLDVTLKLEPGDTVQVVSGPFAQFIAEVEHIDPQQRVWLLLDLMGRTVRTAVPGPSLRAIAPS